MQKIVMKSGRTTRKTITTKFIHHTSLFHKIPSLRLPHLLLLHVDGFCRGVDETHAGKASQNVEIQMALAARVPWGAASSSIPVEHDWCKKRKDQTTECYFQSANSSYDTTLSDIIWYGHVLPDLNTKLNETEPFDHSHAKVTWTQSFLVKARMTGNFILSTESFSSKSVALCISFCQGTSLQCGLGACHCMVSRRPQSRVLPLFMLML